MYINSKHFTSILTPDNLSSRSATNFYEVITWFTLVSAILGFIFTVTGLVTGYICITIVEGVIALINMIVLTPGLSHLDAIRKEMPRFYKLYFIQFILMTTLYPLILLFTIIATAICPVPYYFYGAYFVDTASIVVGAFAAVFCVGTVSIAVLGFLSRKAIAFYMDRANEGKYRAEVSSAEAIANMSMISLSASKINKNFKGRGEYQELQDQETVMINGVPYTQEQVALMQQQYAQNNMQGAMNQMGVGVAETKQYMINHDQNTTFIDEQSRSEYEGQGAEAIPNNMYEVRIDNDALLGNPSNNNNYEGQ